MAILLYNRRGSVTARKLAKTLKLKAVRDDRWNSTMSAPVVRWGTSTPTTITEQQQVNNRGAVATAANGIAMLRVLREAGVNCPEPHFLQEILDQELETACTWLGRKVNHVGGKDIIVCKDDDELFGAQYAGAQYFVPLIRTSMELRVHIIGGRVVKAFKKVNDNPDASFIRSSYRGWSFKRVDIEQHYPRAIPVAVEAVVALGLTFGAVDMAWEIENRRWIVWEVNTAPSLNDETLKIYADHLSKLI